MDKKRYKNKEEKMISNNINPENCDFYYILKTKTKKCAHVFRADPDYFKNVRESVGRGPIRFEMKEPRSFCVGDAVAFCERNTDRKIIKLIADIVDCGRCLVLEDIDEDTDWRLVKGD